MTPYYGAGSGQQKIDSTESPKSPFSRDDSLSLTINTVFDDWVTQNIGLPYAVGWHSFCGKLVIHGAARENIYLIICTPIEYIRTVWLESSLDTLLITKYPRLIYADSEDWPDYALTDHELLSPNPTTRIIINYRCNVGNKRFDITMEISTKKGIKAHKEWEMRLATVQKCQYIWY